MIYVVFQLNPPETANQIYNTGEAVNEILERFVKFFIEHFPNLKSVIASAKKHVFF